MIETIVCSDCVQQCEDECIGHLTEEEQIALFKFYGWKYKLANTPEESIPPEEPSSS